MGPQDIVDTLATLTKAVARVEGRVEELAATAEAAADRAGNAAERAAGSAEGVTSTARAALAKIASLQAEVRTVDRAARALDEARARLVEVPVPGWKWHLVKNPGHAGAASPDRGRSETEKWRKHWVFPCPSVSGFAHFP